MPKKSLLPWPPARCAGLLLCCLLGGLPARPALAYIAMDCELGNKQGYVWTEVTRLTSITQEGAVLMQRAINLFVLYKLLPPYPHELVTAGAWTQTGGFGKYDTMPTNVRGIGFRVKVRQRTLGGPDQLVPIRPTVLDKVEVDSSQAMINTYIQELVLTVPPSQLPSGELKVTKIDGSATLNLWTASMPKDEAQVGDHFELPPNFPPRICRLHYQLSSQNALVEGGGGGPPPISNKCQVEVETIPVKLGDFTLGDFPAVNATTREQPFALTLSNCAASAKPEVTFTDKYRTAGAQAPVDILNLSPGGAEGIGIVMYKEPTQDNPARQRVRYDGTRYKLDRSGDMARLPLSASYIRTATNASQLRIGQANGAAEFTFTFP